MVATAGHVDHGKSSLIVRLTGIDPDRWEEEKRRGLTIDLGFAWTILPSGREVGFVDVPGHERFIRNMLAGVGPVRLVLFVVAADEGWKPQSEEHLEIVDILGTGAGVVALSKRDLVDRETLRHREAEVRGRLGGTALERAPVVACSAVTGEGLDELRDALDAMVVGAPPPEDRGRPRIYIDRSFTIRGAETVVTGTLVGGTLSAGGEVRIYPEGETARIRSLQTHRRPVTVARPVSRVAANLASVAKSEVERGDVLARPGQWRPTSILEVDLAPVPSVGHALSGRGAYKLYIGSAERDVRLRLYGRSELRAGDKSFARVHLSRAVVAELGDRFVLRDAGRRETVGGGRVLDPHPPAGPGADPEARLARREAIPLADLPSLVVRERGAVRAHDLALLAGRDPSEVQGAIRAGPWWVAEEAFQDLTGGVWRILERFHQDHPLRPGMDAVELRRTLAGEADPALGPALDQGLAAEVLSLAERDGRVAREGTAVRLVSHRVTLGDREDEARRIVEAVAAAEPTPPTLAELTAAGFSREVIEACIRTGRLVSISREVVLSPGLAALAEEIARKEAARPGGLTVSRFREILETTRKYALPILAWLDDRRITRRDGDVRRPGGG